MIKKNKKMMEAKIDPKYAIFGCSKVFFFKIKDTSYDLGSFFLKSFSNF
jgi:hypothetical protein